MEMRCYRKILHISYKDHVTNEEVRARIQQAIGPHEDLLTIVKKTQTAVVWSCFPFIRSGQNRLARHRERGKKTRRTKEEVGRLKPVWIDKSISLSSKIRLMRSLVTSIFLYACESWTLTAELQRRIQAMEMRCYCKILHISCMLPMRKSMPRPSSNQSDHMKTS